MILCDDIDEYNFIYNNVISIFKPSTKCSTMSILIGEIKYDFFFSCDLIILQDTWLKLWCNFARYETRSRNYLAILYGNSANVFCLYVAKLHNNSDYAFRILHIYKIVIVYGILFFCMLQN